MAELISGNQIKLDSGKVITPEEGAWYDGRRWLNNALLAPNEYEPGKQVSAETRAQSAAAQGVSLQSFDDYLKNAGAQNISAPITPSYTTGSNQSYVTGLNQQIENARNALDQNLSAQQAKNEAEMAAARAKEEAALKEVEKLTTPFREDLEKQGREQYETDKVLSDQKALLSELDQLLTEGNNLIKQQQEVTGLSAVRNPRIQKTMEDVTARAGVIQAVVALQNTYLSNAYLSIDRSVNAIAQDRQDRLSYYSTVLNLANRDIISLDTQSKKIAEEQLNLLKNDLSRAQDTADYVKKLLIDPNTAMLMAQAGVTLNDSIDVINSKMAQASYAKEVRDMSNSMATSGYSAVYDPKSVPANQLVTITDSKGQKYYYRKSSTSGNGFDMSTFFNNLTQAGFKVNGTDTKTTTNNQASVDLIWNEVLNQSVATMAGKPNFIPAGGIGTTWTDSTGISWTYTQNGWSKGNLYQVSSSGNNKTNETKTPNLSLNLDNKNELSAKLKN
jgi:hypothetical protein